MGHPTPSTALRPTVQALHPTPHTLDQTPYTLSTLTQHPTPCILTLVFNNNVIKRSCLNVIENNIAIVINNMIHNAIKNKLENNIAIVIKNFCDNVTENRLKTVATMSRG